ncbi:MAG: glycosyltransferase family 9 protein [Desulfonauticus sp.]|nr:glycosyltransferase family 9 protein [Desulfonauticus sp.]
MSSWPDELKNTLIFWFKIQKNPSLEPNSSNITYFYLTSKQNLPVRTYLQQQFIQLNIPWLTNWENFLNLTKKNNPKYLLIFPGSGHPAKNWPLQNFYHIAKKFQSRVSLRFVLGPAEHRLKILNFSWIQLETIPELISILQQTFLVLGNDSGPMHLASLLKIPGIVLFGPTNHQIWQPEHLHLIKSPCACAPCSNNAQINCANPKCMSEISIEKVEKTLHQLLQCHHK